MNTAGPIDGGQLEALRAELVRLAAEREASVAERDAVVAERDRAVTELDAVAAERDRAIEAKKRLERKIAWYEQKLDDLLRQLYGRKSERIDPNQILFDFAKAEAAEPLPSPPHLGEAPDGETPDDEGPPDERRPRKQRKKGHGWGRLPAHLERQTVEVTPDEWELECDCCGGRRTSISSPEVTERLDYIPGSLIVKEIVRHRFRCPRCQDGTVIAPLPAPALDVTRGRAEPGLLAHIIVSKYNDHLPLYRQSEILAREDVDLSRSTLCDWVHGTAALLQPIASAVLQDIRSRPVIGLDETGIRVVFDKYDKVNGTRNARMWAYRGLPGEIYFTFSETKAKHDIDGPLVVLAGFSGYVQADAASSLDDLFLDGSRLEVGCNAHARRKFFNARKTHPQEAAFAIEVYRQVYGVERRVRGASAQERLEARQTESKPLLASFDAWIDALAASPALVPGTPLATAVGYSRNHRVALRRFLDHPQLSPDNNAVERALRLVALGRKNWIFAGSEAAARDTGVLYTLIGSCRELGISSWEYVRDLIQERTTNPGAPASTLTPRSWQRARAPT